MINEDKQKELRDLELKIRQMESERQRNLLVMDRVDYYEKLSDLYYEISEMKKRIIEIYKGDK